MGRFIYEGDVKTEIEDDLAIPADDAVCVSGKTGEGIHDLLESIVFLISPPKGDANAPLKALILDSYFDEYRGVVATVRIFDGSIKKGDTLRMMQAKGDFLVDGVGVKRPAETPVDALTVGEVGYVVTGLKDPEAVRVGDTLTWASNPCPEPLPGYREAKPMVYTGLFPIDNKDYENLRDALDKLHVNDPSLVWEPETSVALGFGFRVGFLGLLHMEVVKERLEREFNLDLIATSPSVDYHVYKTDGEMIDVRSPQDLPEATRIERIEEPYLKAKIICPPEYTGAVMQLAIEHRGITTDMIHLTSKSVEMRFDMPLAELILDFFDQLKSSTKGYASLDYEIIGYKATNLVKIDILLNKETIDTFNTSDTRGNSPSYGTTFQKMGHELLSRDELAVLDGGKCILQLRGVRPFLSDKYDLTQHPNYKLTSDYDPKNTFDIEKYLNRKEKIHPGDEFIVVDADSLPSA